MPSATVVAPSALFRKQTAELSGGVYQRGAVLNPANASQYNTRAQAGAQLSMSIIQALLAILSGHVQSWATTSSTERGIVMLLSTTRQGIRTLFSWDLSVPEAPRYGGFANGLTYQVVEIHLLWCLLAERKAANAQSGEVAERWEQLCQEMQRFTAPAPGGWWTTQQVARVCRNGQVRDQLEQVADALWFSLRYLLPDKRLDRAFTLVPAPEVPSSPRLVETRQESSSLLLAPQRLVTSTSLARPTRLSPSDAGDPSRSSTLDEVREKRLESMEASWQLPDANTWFW